MITSDQTHIDANEQAFDLEELVHVEETSVFFKLSLLKQSQQEKYAYTSSY